MYHSFATRFLCYLHQKLAIDRRSAPSGFTLLELLVVIIIIGVLATIAIPSFFSQAAKAREAEAKQYIGSANRAQQLLYLEKQEFYANPDQDVSVNYWDSLGLGIAEVTQNYKYRTGTMQKESQLADYTQAARAYANPVHENLRSYIGVVDVVAMDNAVTTHTILCQAQNIGKLLDFETSAAQGGTVTLTKAANMHVTITDRLPECNSEEFRALE
ncbi:MAG: type IV pilin-like G/H family protein [Prochlorothrix sp.]|nr:type IV pilin-like G/H family protein [Prochlorothrix sp.]